MPPTLPTIVPRVSALLQVVAKPLLQVWVITAVARAHTDVNRTGRDLAAATLLHAHTGALTFPHGPMWEDITALSLRTITGALLPNVLASLRLPGPRPPRPPHPMSMVMAAATDAPSPHHHYYSRHLHRV